MPRTHGDPSIRFFPVLKFRPVDSTPHPTSTTASPTIPTFISLRMTGCIPPPPDLSKGKMPPAIIRSESAALARVEKQLDDLQVTVNTLSTFVQGRVSTLDSAVEQAATASKRWWDVQWPQHERHHDEIQRRIGITETALARHVENALAISTLSTRVGAIEDVIKRGQGAVWASRVLLIAAGAALPVLAWMLTHGFNQ